MTNRKIPTTYIRVQRLKGELAMSLSRSVGSAIGTFCIDTLCIKSILRPRERSLHSSPFSAPRVLEVLEDFSLILESASILSSSSELSMSRSIGSAMGTFCIDTLSIAILRTPGPRWFRKNSPFLAIVKIA